MKRIIHSCFVPFLLLCVNAICYPQGVSINSTGDSNHPSAILDISCTDQGILIPRMTEAQRNAVINPAEGLCIYNTTTNNFNVFNGIAWIELRSTFITSTSGTVSPGTGVAINTTGADPDPSAKLDVSSTDKGLLIPRTTAASITGPATGLIIYDNSTRSISAYDGSSWIDPCFQYVAASSATGTPATGGEAINTSGSPADASAMLDLTAADQGLLIPRLTNAQRNSLLPATGLLIYNTESGQLEFWNGSGWYSTGNSEGEGFITEWTTTAPGETITLPLNSSNGSAFNCTVNWGDASTSTITAFNDPDRTHVYASAGTYQVEITGICEGWSFNNTGDRLKINKVISWGDPCKFSGFKYLKNGFYGCANLTSVADFISASGAGCILDGFYGIFQNCAGLTSVPENLFSMHTGVSANAFSLAFYGCSGLTDIPGNLFRYNTAVSSAGFSSAFAYCTGLNTLPADLFRYNTAVTAFTSTFYGCSGLTSIPEDLFRYNTAVSVSAFRYTFRNCAGLTSLPDDLFRYNTSVSTSGFDGTFNGCSGLTSLPVDLFRYNTAVSGFQETFYGCSGLTSLPADLFKYNTLVSSSGFSRTFYGCTGLTSLPVDLFRYNTAVSSYGFYQTFYGCTGLTSLPVDLFRYNTAVSSYGFHSTFYGCAGLTSLPADLFRYNINVSSSCFVGTFRDCINLTSLPADLFKYNTLLSTDGFWTTFYGCSGLTSIPVDLFRYNTAVSTHGFSGTFYGCTGLTTLPTDLFRYNTAVSTYGFYQTFRACTGLTNLPVDLFRYNTDVSTYGFYQTFFGCTGLTSLPVDLFRYNMAVSTNGFFQTFYECTNLQLNRNIFFADGEEGTRFLSQTPNFYRCFYRTSFTGTIGEAPSLWLCTFGSTPTSTGCYGGVGNSTSSLSNYDDILAGWK